MATSSLRWFTIVEDGVGGRTYASDFVILTIDSKKSTKVRTAEMLVHELAHAVRWGKNPELSENLFCELVNEGLAVCVEAEFAKTQDEKARTFFSNTILSRNEEENWNLFKELKSKFKNSRYDYDGIFFGNEKWSRWSGYSVGYYIVRKYLEKTERTIFEIIDTNYDEIWKAVGSLL